MNCSGLRGECWWMTAAAPCFARNPASGSAAGHRRLDPAGGRAGARRDRRCSAPWLKASGASVPWRPSDALAPRSKFDSRSSTSSGARLARESPKSAGIQLYPAGTEISRDEIRYRIRP
jgi:hypothetical protein